jgi:hypothetical protein
LVVCEASGFVCRALAPVAVCLLLVVLLVLLPVRGYLERKADRLDHLATHWQEHPARLWVHQNSVPFSVSNLPLDEVVAQLNKEMAGSARVVLHLSEHDRTIRVSYSPNADEYVRLAAVLEVLRVKIESVTGHKVKWTARGRDIDFHYDEENPSDHTQPETEETTTWRKES